MLQEQQVIFYAIIVGIVALVIYLSNKGTKETVIEDVANTLIEALSDNDGWSYIKSKYAIRKEAKRIREGRPLTKEELLERSEAEKELSYQRLCLAENLLGLDFMTKTYVFSAYLPNPYSIMEDSFNKEALMELMKKHSVTYTGELTKYIDNPDGTLPLFMENYITPDTKLQVELINSMADSLNIIPLDIENSNEEQALEFIEKHKKYVKMFNILRSIENSFIIHSVLKQMSDIESLLTPVYDECTDSERDIINILLKQYGFEFDGKMAKPIIPSKKSKLAKKLINTPISLDLSRGSGEKKKPKKKTTKPKVETPKKTTLLEPIVKRKKKQ